MALSKYNIVKTFVFFQTEQSDEVFIKFLTFHVRLEMHLHVQAPFWSAVVAEPIK